MLLQSTLLWGNQALKANKGNFGATLILSDIDRSNRLVVFLEKGVLKICSNRAATEVRCQ